MSEQQKRIYQTDGDRYEALVAREDYQGNIMRALDEIVNVDGLDILDLGAGTGRLAVMLAPRAGSIRAFDVPQEMLRVCRLRLEASGLSNWQVGLADHRQLPAEDSSADLVVSGWSLSYLAVWNPETWRVELEKACASGRKAVRFSGKELLMASFRGPRALAGNSSFTVAAWVNNPEVGESECFLSWAGRGGPDAATSQFGYGTHPEFGAVGHWGFADMGFRGGPPKAGQWHHLAVTFDGVIERVYVDGQLNNSKAKMLMMHEGRPIYVGASDPGSEYFDGYLASLRVYGGALSEVEVKKLAAEEASADVLVHLDAAKLDYPAAVPAPGSSTAAESGGAAAATRRKAWCACRTALLQAAICRSRMSSCSAKVGSSGQGMRTLPPESISHSSSPQRPRGVRVAVRVMLGRLA